MPDMPVRQWQFWRTGFWLRPALVLLASLGLMAVSPAILTDIPHALAAGRALDEGTICGTAASSTQPCLEPVSGVLDGPRSQRGPDTEWWFFPDDGGRLLTFDAGLGSGLMSGERAVAMVFEDKRVAAVVLGEHTIRTREAGLRGAVAIGGIAVLGVATGVVGLGYGWSTWRRTRSWFAVNGHGWDNSTMSRFSLRLLIGVFVGLIAWGAVAIGVPWWVGLIPPLIMLELWIVYGRRRGNRA